MISLVIPTRNNLKYVQSAYDSIRKHLGNEIEVILLDDASTDGTWDWIYNLSKSGANIKIHKNHGPERVGHTVLYDVGAKMATNEIFGIFHADMIASPNYVKNMVKHLKRGRVVSATRIEPPLHPPGPEKYVIDFGLEPEVFQESEFLRFINAAEGSDGNKDKTSTGIFAPWIMYVDDFFAIGGHDKRVFAPMELEDSDLFNRFLLKGYELVQSRDAFVYHMTCRGSRFKDGIKIVQEIPLAGGNVWKRSQDSEEYTKLRQNKFKEWWRKWHSDVHHDANMLPIVHPRYNIGYIVENCPLELIPHLEPWCDTLYIENQAYIDLYVEDQQPESKFYLRNRLKTFNVEPDNDIFVQFDARKFGNDQFNVLKMLPLMIQDSGEYGMMEFDIFTLKIVCINDLKDKLIHADDLWYVRQLI
jgi:glycosyltransferase involved in cell wall biosynthesis